jgi:hypothetical protein
VRSRWQGEKNAPLKNLPYPFPGFGPRDNSEQEQIPFPPSPAVPEESAGGHNDEEEDEGGTVVEVEDDGEEEEEEEEEIIRSIPGQARNHHRSPAVHPTAFRALASLFPAATHSHFVTLPEGAACHPRAHLPSPSRVPLRHHRARAPQPASRRRRIAQAMRRQRPLLHHLLVAPPLRPSLPLRLCRALRMYAACPCPHAIQLSQVVANAPRQHQVLFPLHQRVVFRPRGHDKRSKGTVGSCVIALARKSYRSLTARTTALPARDSLRLMDHSRRANAKILLACFLRLHLSQVLGHHYLAHAMVAQLLSHESVALSALALVRGIQAQVQPRAAVGVHDTIPMSQCLAHL